jgi:uncharacterized protein (TIGR02145 family)
MKKSILLFTAILLVVSTSIYSQKPSIELTFVAEYYGQSIQLDSILIKNLTQGGDTTLYYPDNFLVLDYTTGQFENQSSVASIFSITQNYPNPLREKTTFSVNLPQKDNLQINVVNLLGQKVAFYENTLETGNHSFTFYPGNEKNYILAASMKGVTKSIKMVSLNNNSGKRCSLIYTGNDKALPGYKSGTDMNEFGFSLGDSLMFIGYAETPAVINGSDVITDAPQSNQTYTFEILEGIPCLATPIVAFEGQTYNTLQIGNQCWLKENINIGTMINGTYNQTNNNQTEKYCYENDPANCAIYGGLYQWDEMMQYTIQQGTQGICPAGWHLPSNSEWTVLTEFLGGDAIAGGKMKSTGTIEVGTGLWFAPNTSATNESGITALPGGGCTNGGGFNDLGFYAGFWSSTEDATYNGWGWTQGYCFASVSIFTTNKNYSFSVRCIRNLDFQGQVAYWTFENNANDQVGNYNPSPDGIVDLEYTDSYTSDAGQCGYFNGTTSIVEIPNGDQLANTSDFTLSFWVKANSIGHVGANGEPKGHFVIGLGAFYGFQFEISADYSSCKLAVSYELADGGTASEDMNFAGDG